MGCDIHVYLEGKLASGRWALLDMPLDEGSCITGISDDETHVFRYGGERHQSYPTFAALADVRNDFNITPISEPRGIPEDSSLFLKDGEFPKCYWLDYRDSERHSHSWLTVREILAYDWGKVQQPWMSGEPPFLRWVRDKVAPLGDPDELRVVFWFDN